MADSLLFYRDLRVPAANKSAARWRICAVFTRLYWHRHSASVVAVLHLRWSSSTHRSNSRADCAASLPSAPELINDAVRLDFTLTRARAGGGREDREVGTAGPSRLHRGATSHLQLSQRGR